MKTVLFVCVENACRSQMAEGFAQALGKGVLKAYSAGTKPSGIVNPQAVAVMKEDGIDISKHISKGFFDLPVRSFDYVVTMGCQDVCPFVPAINHLEWQISDPKGKDIDFFRTVRYTIKTHVERFIAQIPEAKQ